MTKPPVTQKDLEVDYERLPESKEVCLTIIQQFQSNLQEKKKNEGRKI